MSNFTPRAQAVIAKAKETAKFYKHEEADLIHVFAAFIESCGEYAGQISEALVKFGINFPILNEETKTFLKEGYRSSKTKETNLKTLCKAADALSKKYDHKYVGVEHLFVCLFDIEDQQFIEFVSKIQKLEKVVDYLEKSLEEGDVFNLEERQQNNDESVELSKKFLTANSICLNSQVAEGKIPKLYVNNKLIQQLSEILCRKNKNNPLIIGEAGVGKTALVESLAQCIVEKKCSDFLALKQIYALDVPMIVAGCKYRGEFEEKIKNILKEAAQDPNVVLFIDEIHTIIGAGNPENGMDVANILKPYLARGDISCIGATTFDEYRKTIADDPALNRRFQCVKIEEPSKQETIDLLKNIKTSYEEFHCVEFSDEMIAYAVEVSEKNVSGRFPDKALDLLDQTGASVKLDLFKKSADMIAIEDKLKGLIDKYTKNPTGKTLTSIESLLKKYQNESIKLVARWQNNKYQITKLDILKTVSNKINVPLEDLQQQDFEKLLRLKSELTEQVVGQKDQCEQIYKTLLRAKAGFRNIDKPVASFMLAGPSGVGKTLTAKIIAEKMFPSKNCFVYLDMSEYADKTALNKLIGSNAGYVGYERGGVLTERVRKNPHCIVLFDEIHKADAEVISCAMQILEEGKITDSYGNIVDFSNAIVVFTAAAEPETLANSMGFAAPSTILAKNDFSKQLKSIFPNDFLSRIDEIVSFDNLNEVSVKEIFFKQTNKFCAELKNRGVDAVIEDGVVEFLQKKADYRSFGARQVAKIIEKYLQIVAAEHLLQNTEDKNIGFLISDGQIKCKSICEQPRLSCPS